MTDASRTVLERFLVRKSKAQKAAFRDWLCRTLTDAGYAPRVDEGRYLVKNHNVVVGDPARAQVVFTAHYDTCAALPFPNFITPRNPVVFLLFQVLLCVVMFVAAAVVTFVVALLIPALPKRALGMVWAVVLLFFCWWMMAGKANRHTVNDNTSGVLTLLEIALTLPTEDREKAAFVFFDNEEKGLFGSAAFAKRHKQELKNTPILNFDCVSDGDHILFFPTKRCRRDADAMDRLRAAFQGTEEKEVLVADTGVSIYPSDQGNFRLGVGIAAFHKNRVVGYCLGRIHTGRDTVLDERNIELLREGALAFLGAGDGGETPV